MITYLLTLEGLLADGQQPVVCILPNPSDVQTLNRMDVECVTNIGVPAKTEIFVLLPA
jgi:hypothetical protein